MQEEKNDLKKRIINYLKTSFNKKNNLWRLFFFSISLFIVLIISIPLNSWAYNKGEGYTEGNNGFIQINVVFNNGNAFGGGHDWPQALNYFLKIFMSLIILFIALFCIEWYYALPLYMSFVGGLFNVFDKFFHNDNVIDYFALFPPKAWFVFNAPDFFITCGILFAFISYIIIGIKNYLKNKKNK